jgi:hypothetical protein
MMFWKTVTIEGILIQDAVFEVLKGSKEKFPTHFFVCIFDKPSENS